MDDNDTMVSADEARVMLERARHGASVMRDHARATGDEDRAEQYRTHAEDLDAAAMLARTVIAMHAIIEGRATAPSFEENSSARRAGLYPVKLANRWHLYDDDGRMCAWPTVPQRPAGCICDFRDGKHRFSCLRQQPTLAVTRDEGGAFRVAGTEVDRGE